MNEFAVGTIVIHPKLPVWGPGKVVRTDGRSAFVVWRDRSDRAAKKMDTSYLAIAAVQSDEILDNLPPVVEKNGQLVLPAERITVAAAIEAFQRRFPLGFEDPLYIGDRKIGERAYKVLAHEYLDAEFGNGKLRSRLSGDIGGVIDVVNKAIGMVNLLAVQESLALRFRIRCVPSSSF